MQIMMHPMNFHIPTEQDIQTAFEQGEAAVQNLVYALAKQIEELAQLPAFCAMKGDSHWG